MASLTLNWDAVNWNGQQDKYNIYRNGSFLTTVPAGTTSYTDNGLDYGVTYSYRVSAENVTGESPKSNSASGQTFWPVTIDGQKVQEITIDGQKVQEITIDGTTL